MTVDPTRSLAFTALLEFDPAFGRIDSRHAGRYIDAFVEAFEASTVSNMIAFAKGEWVSREAAAREEAEQAD